MNDNDPWGWVYAPNPDLRAGDQDRESVAQRLRGHHADGRLDTDEFAQRVDRCYQARTIGELDRLLADLPRAPAPQRQYTWRPEVSLAAAIIPMIVALAAISTLTHRHLIWLAFPIAFLARRYTHRRRYAPSTLTPARHSGSAGRGSDAPAI
jgi:hypothetical protein